MSALWSQADILVGLATRLHSGSSRQSQMDQQNAQPEARSDRNRSRGQLPVTILANRESRGRNQGQRRQGQSGGGSNAQVPNT